jgi:hypothetical protein
MIVLGAVAVSSAGLWYAIADNKEREYVGFYRLPPAILASLTRAGCCLIC